MLYVLPHIFRLLLFCEEPPELPVSRCQQLEDDQDLSEHDSLIPCEHQKHAFLSNGVFVSLTILHIVLKMFFDDFECEDAHLSFFVHSDLFFGWWSQDFC